MNGGFWGAGFWGSRLWGLGLWGEVAVVPTIAVVRGMAGPARARYREAAVHVAERFRPRTTPALLPRLIVSATVRFGTTERPVRTSALELDRLLAEETYAPLRERPSVGRAPKPIPVVRGYRVVSSVGILPEFSVESTVRGGWIVECDVSQPCVQAEFSVGRGRIVACVVSVPFVEAQVDTRFVDPWATQRTLEDEVLVALVRFGIL
jgi:hypothetical protein